LRRSLNEGGHLRPCAIRRRELRLPQAKAGNGLTIGFLALSDRGNHAAKISALFLDGRATLLSQRRNCLNELFVSNLLRPRPDLATKDGGFFVPAGGN